MRKKVIAANFKMNYSAPEAEVFVSGIIDSINTSEVVVVICPNFTALESMSNLLENKEVKLGAQNVCYETRGAYTGEVSADMLNAVGVDYCIVGHSERRQYFQETDEIVSLKVKKLLERGIKPILCVGETLEQRNQNMHLIHIEEQLTKALHEVEAKEVKNNLVIAYEPIWAIGTGVTATGDQAQEMCAYIRDVIKKLYSPEVAECVVIQYGGSVNAKNVSSLLNLPDIDGALVGGASLTNEFVSIVNYEII